MSQSRAWTWRHAIIKSDLPATTRHVLLTISCFMNELGDGCYPTQVQLAEATGLSERAVREHLDHAEKAGWIKRTEHGFRGQKWRNHEYQACWPDPQDIEKGAEPGAGPSDEGAERGAGKVRNVVPKGAERGAAYQSKDSSIDQSTSAQAREREEDFKILWEAWPTGYRPDSREAAATVFAKLSSEDRSKALLGVRSYCRAMALRRKRLQMMPYLKQKRFADYHDEPELDEDGRFIIRPKSPEWAPWLGAVREKFGEPGVQSIVRNGFFRDERRWPDGENRSSA